jgi:hypothetical protein
VGDREAEGGRVTLRDLRFGEELWVVRADVVSEVWKRLS